MLNSQKTQADALYYAIERQAAANALLHTEKFIALELGRAVANNTKIFFGNSPVAMMTDFVESLTQKLHQVK